MSVALPEITLADIELEERRAEARRYQAATEGSSKAAAHWKRQLAILQLAKAGIVHREKADA